MQSHLTWKLAASSALVALTAVGCKPAAMSYRPVTASAQASKSQARAASDFFAKAEAAAMKRDFAAALEPAERAVALSPRDTAYRMVLADLYVKNGRFLSAEATYGDVLTLNPDNKRAAISRVLAQIALGRTGEAFAALDALSGVASASDIGLAYALAGDPKRAVAILESAARTQGADGRVRQNLALSYALAGDWQKARVTASQDTPADQLPARMEQWAAFAQPKTSFDQVASLLGVTPRADAGQPVQLALAPAALPAEVPVAVAQAEPVPAPVAAPEPVTLAEAWPEPDELQIQYAAAAEGLVEPQRSDAVVAEIRPAEAPLPAFEPAKKKPRVAGEVLVPKKPAPAKPKKAASPYVVQLGAYSSEMSLDRAWTQAQRRYALGGDELALSTTVSLPGKGTLHRLSVSGFGNRGEAVALCEAIKAKGGACFVRQNAGDAPVRWASLRAGRTNRA